MKVVVYILFPVVLLFSACVEEVPPFPEPEPLIPRNEMVTILADMEELEAYVQLKYAQVSKFHTTLSVSGDSLLKAHGYNYDQFEANMDFYGSDQKEMIAIFEEVKKELESRSVEMKKGLEGESNKAE